MVRAPSAPFGALFVLPLLPFAAAQCMQSWEQALFPYLPCLIMPAWLLPYQPSTCLPFHNLLVSCGFCLAGHLHPGFLFPLIIRLVPPNHTVLPDSL